MSVPPPVTQSSDERTWGMICHLAAFSGAIGVPFGNILGPLVAWLIKKDQYPFVDDQGKESLNFQISMIIYGFVLFLLAIPLFIWSICSRFPFALLIITPLGIVLGVIDIVLVIIAAVAANNGQAYRYPITIRFIR